MAHDRVSYVPDELAVQVRKLSLEDSAAWKTKLDPPPLQHWQPLCCECDKGKCRRRC